MDTKSLGIILTKMRERDEVRFVDVENDKEFHIYEWCYHSDHERDKLVVEFLIREIKKNDKHR